MTVTDSLGSPRLAGLSHVQPNRISLVVPEEVSLGSASVIVRRGGTASEAFSVEIAAVAPGLFSANVDGTGVAWGQAIRVDADGEYSYESFADFDAPIGSRTAVPLSLGAETDKLYLWLIGTGIRGWNQELEALIGDSDVDIDFAAPHSTWPGLDVVVLGPLPPHTRREWRGRGRSEGGWPIVEFGYGLDPVNGSSRSGMLAPKTRRKPKSPRKTRPNWNRG